MITSCVPSKGQKCYDPTFGSSFIITWLLQPLGHHHHMIDWCYHPDSSHHHSCSTFGCIRSFISNFISKSHHSLVLSSWFITSLMLSSHHCWCYDIIIRVMTSLLFTRRLHHIIVGVMTSSWLVHPKVAFGCITSSLLLWSHHSIIVVMISSQHHCWCNRRRSINQRLSWGHAAPWFNLGSFRTHFRLKLGST